MAAQRQRAATAVNGPKKEESATPDAGKMKGLETEDSATPDAGKMTGMAPVLASAPLQIDDGQKKGMASSQRSAVCSPRKRQKVQTTRSGGDNHAEIFLYSRSSVNVCAGWEAVPVWAVVWQHTARPSLTFKISENLTCWLAQCPEGFAEFGSSTAALAASLQSGVLVGRAGIGQ